VLFLPVVVLANNVVFGWARLRLAKKEILVEVARTPEEQARGLMFRKNLPNDMGMLFIYSEEQRLSFWMKNTFIPLSIGFFDKNQALVDVQEMEPVKSEMQSRIPTYQSVKPAKYALEMPPGWFKKNKIRLGDRFLMLENKR
jgi:uncharacterized membrane protein (UPF0127 family)